MKKNLIPLFGLAFAGLALTSCGSAYKPLGLKTKDKPVIFYNRFPFKDAAGTQVDTDTLNHNPNTFYVGPSPKQGGVMQGDLILNYIKDHTAAELDRNGDGALGYVMLVGQQGQDACIYRSNEVRKKLDTYTAKFDKDLTSEMKVADYEAGKSNRAKVGKATTKDGKELQVKELIAAISQDAGGTWSNTQANNLAASWKTTYGDKIDLIISNNDGMGMTVYNSIVDKNYRVPVFGFDANTDAVNAINPDGEDAKTKGIAYGGTISQNAEGQTYLVLQVIRNVLDGVKFDDKGGYTMPTSTTKTKQKDLAENKEYEVDLPDVLVNGISKETAQGGISSSATWYTSEDKQLQTTNTMIDSTNWKDYASGVPLDKKVKAVADDAREYNVFLTCYNSADNFVNGQLLPTFKQYAKLLKLNLTIVSGDGNNESLITNSMNNLDNYEAFILNMTSTNAGQTYMDILK